MSSAKTAVCLAIAFVALVVVTFEVVRFSVNVDENTRESIQLLRNS